MFRGNSNLAITETIGKPFYIHRKDNYMSTLLTINVKNLESATQEFYFFQEPAVYTGGSQVFSNSLFSQSLGSC